MNRKLILFAVIAALIWTATPACSSGTDSQDANEASLQSKAENMGVKWYGYDEGMALGKKEGKKILLHFYADWCIYCKKMNRDIFSQSDAANFINTNFIPIRVNSDNEKQLAEAYRVSGLPTTCLLDKNGEQILRIPGYLPKKMFMSYMKFIQTDSYLSMSFKAFMGME